MKQMRKEVAELLRSNKEENARIRVEAVIREINLLQVIAPKLPNYHYLIKAPASIYLKRCKAQHIA